MWQDPYFQRALWALTGLVFITGPMGCYLVWRRMSYFGDSLSHGGLLGVALGVLIGVGSGVGIVFTCFFLSLFLLYLQNRADLSNDTLLGIFAHGTLALGLVVISLSGHIQANIMDFLIGDILSVSLDDLIWIFGSAFLLLPVICFYWNDIVLFILHEDLAVAEGIKTTKIQIFMMFSLAIIVAIAIQIVGVLLMTALMIIPAAAARQVSTSPKMMACLAIFLGWLAGLFGLVGSFLYDVPTGPMIVVLAMCLFILLSVIGYKRHN